MSLSSKFPLRHVCNLKLAWDDEFTGELLDAWEQWKTNLSDLGGIRIPRCYFSLEEIAHMELHNLADASEIEYGTVSYMRKVDEDGEIECSFIVAKSRTPPTPFVTVSRLENLIKRERDWSTYCTGYLQDRLQSKSAIHTERRMWQTG